MERYVWLIVKLGRRSRMRYQLSFGNYQPSKNHGKCEVIQDQPLHSIEVLFMKALQEVQLSHYIVR
jgi:hypothetical protein